MAHEATMLDDAQQVLAHQRKQTQAHYDQILGAAKGNAVDDEMGVHIGDIINQQSAPTRSAPARPSVLSWLPIALSIASMLGTCGIGLAVLSAIRSIPAPPAVQAPVQPVLRGKDVRVRFWIEDGKAKFSEPEEVKQ